MATVAWIGLGAMGSRMAMRLVDAGHQVIVWNRTPHRAESLTRRETVRVAAPASRAAAKAEVVALMVTDPAGICDVVHGPDGLAAGITPGSTAVDFSTGGPAAVTALGAGLPPDVAVLDSPVLGSIADAEAGTLKLLVGGAPDLITEAADRGGVDLRLGRALATWLADAATAGLGDRDYTSVLGQILSAGPPAGESA